MTNKKVLEKLRRQRVRRLSLRFGLFVLLPTLLGVIYYGLIASDQYESYAQFTVHAAEGPTAAGLDGILGAALGTPSRDTLVVRDHILSRDMLARLDEEHGFIGHYQGGDVDFVSRLDSDATFEEAYELYDHKVQVEFDSISGNLTLRVRAYTPAKAEELARAILEYSEEKVNDLTERERLDRTRYAEAEVEKCETRLANARKTLLTQQRKHAELNPLDTAGSAMRVRTELEAELAKARAQLMEARSFMKSDAPKVRALKDRVKALSAQVGHEKKRLVDPEGKGKGSLAESLAEFDAAMVEKQFAEKAYEIAMATLEAARSDAIRQHRYLAVIAEPSRPDESTYPERALSVLTVFIVCFLLLGIGSLLVAAVREHARV